MAGEPAIGFVFVQNKA